MMPSANTDSFSSAPPLSRFTSWNTPAPLLVDDVAARSRQVLTFFTEMPGVGRDAPSRNIAMMKSVKSSFLRRSGVRKARRKPVSMRRPHVEGSTSAVPGRGARPDGSWATPAPKSNPTVALRQPGTVPWPPPGRAAARARTRPAAAAVISQLSGRSAGGGDLLPGGGGERVRGHPQPGRCLAGAEHLDQLARAHRSPGNQVVGGDVAAIRVERGQPVEVDDLVGGLEWLVGEALELGQPAVQRHLAAFECGGHLAARLGALGAAACRLALRCLAAADPGAGRARTRSGPQVVNLETPAIRGCVALAVPGLAGLAGLCHVSQPPRRRPGGAPPGSCRGSPAGRP